MIRQQQRERVGVKFPQELVSLPGLLPFPDGLPALNPVCIGLRRTGQPLARTRRIDRQLRLLQKAGCEQRRAEDGVRTKSIEGHNRNRRGGRQGNGRNRISIPRRRRGEAGRGRHVKRQLQEIQLCQRPQRQAGLAQGLWKLASDAGEHFRRRRNIGLAAPQKAEIILGRRDKLGRGFRIDEIAPGAYGRLRLALLEGRLLGGHPQLELDRVKLGNVEGMRGRNQGPRRRKNQSAGGIDFKREAVRRRVGAGRDLIPDFGKEVVCNCLRALLRIVLGEDLVLPHGHPPDRGEDRDGQQDQDRLPAENGLELDSGTCHRIFVASVGRRPAAVVTFMQNPPRRNPRVSGSPYLELFQILTHGCGMVFCREMSRTEKNLANGPLWQRLRTSGFRFTPQRQRVYDVLLVKRDHPTAEEVFIRSKREMPEISMATVYNCLDALVQCGMVRQVQLERGATRYCPNMQEHCHYYCDACGEVFDVALPARSPSVPRPKGFRVDHYEIAVHGICSACSGTKHRGATAAGRGKRL